MLDVELAKETIKDRGWLSALPSAFREQVVERSKALLFEPGETIFRLGDDAHGLYGLGAGAVRLDLIAAEQGPVYAHILSPGAWIGDNALIGDVRRLTFKSTRQSILFFLDMRDVEELIKQDWRRWRFFQSLTVQNLNVAIGAGMDLMVRDPRHRCAMILLRLGGYRHTTNVERERPEIDVTQEDLARMTNLSRNMINRILGEFRDLGFLDWRYRQISLLNPVAMRNWLETEAD